MDDDLAKRVEQLEQERDRLFYACKALEAENKELWDIVEMVIDDEENENKEEENA